MTIWRTRIACWIPKATDTNSEYALLIVFPTFLSNKTSVLWLHMLLLGEISELKSAELWFCEFVYRPVGSTRSVFVIHLTM
jgi:hypothetical protein